MDFYTKTVWGGVIAIILCIVFATAVPDFGANNVVAGFLGAVGAVAVIAGVGAKLKDAQDRDEYNAV